MVKTTRKQRETLWARWDRMSQRPSYLAFRRTVQATFGCDGAVVVFWCGMWVCIERDGYAHT